MKSCSHPFIPAIASILIPVGICKGAVVVDESTYPGLFGGASEVTVVHDLSGLIVLDIGGSASGPLGSYWTASAEGGAGVAALGIPAVSCGAQVSLTGHSLEFGLSSDPSSLTGLLGTTTGLALGWSATAKFDKEGSEMILQPNSKYRVAFDIDAGGSLLQSAVQLGANFGFELLDGNNNAVGSVSDGTLVNLLGIELIDVVGAPTPTRRAVVDFVTGNSVPAGEAGIRFSGSALLPVSLLGIGTDFATVSGLSVSYIDPYTDWIEDTEVPEGPAWDPDADPDGDGRTNLEEFALSTDPAVADPNNVFMAVGDADGEGPETSVGVMTIPVRRGGVFAPSDGDLVCAVDGISYRVEGSFNLALWAEAVSEVVPNDGFKENLPELPEEWTYRSFRLPGETSATPRAFFRVHIDD